MEKFSLFNLLVVSIPEEFLMALFAWVILGKKGDVKIRNVVMAGLILAVSFEALRVMLYDYVEVYVILQAIIFILVVYFMYRLNYISAILGSLLTMVIFLVVQSSVMNVGFSITGYTFDDFNTSGNQEIMVRVLKAIFIAVESSIIGIICYFLSKKDLKVFSFQNNKRASEFYSNRIRYLVLQLVFTFLIVFINGVFYYKHLESMDDLNSKVMIVINFSVIAIFTILVVKSAFKMGESIQREEEMKRMLDGREFSQNIDYLCKLMELERYGEVKKILPTMKYQVDRMKAKEKRINRGTSIK